MKWILVLAIFAGIGFLAAWVSYRNNREELSYIFGTVVVVATVSLLTFALMMTCDRKKSEIEYAQLAETRAQIEQAFQSDNALAQAEALKLVVDYNATVTRIRINLDRPIVGELYSKKVDWSSLEIIDWAVETKGE